MSVYVTGAWVLMVCWFPDVVGLALFRNDDCVAHY